MLWFRNFVLHSNCILTEPRRGASNPQCSFQSKISNTNKLWRHLAGLSWKTKDSTHQQTAHRKTVTGKMLDTITVLIHVTYFCGFNSSLLHSAMILVPRVLWRGKVQYCKLILISAFTYNIDPFFVYIGLDSLIALKFSLSYFYSLFLTF